MLVIEGRIFFKGKLTQGMIGIEDGRITDVKKVLKGDDHMDVGDRVVLPGAVDPHVHFRDPGLTHKEDFVSGSTAALYGGVTCVLDMPNTKPPVVNANALEEKKRIIRGRSFVDYGLFAALTPKTDAEALAKNVCGFKLFMGSTTGDILTNDDGGIYKAMSAAARTGKRISVHAEDNSMLGNGEEKNNRDHLRNRPVSAEHSAIQRLAPFKGMPINICHVTDAASVALASSLGFLTEVTTHHLFFADSVSESAEYKVNPPLRDSNTKEKLYKAFAERKITMFGTDHAPHTIDEKRRIYSDAPSGIPGVETYVPIMMDLVKSGNVQLDQLVKMACTAPAEAFGINKGIIEKGRDADLMIFDMKAGKRIKERGLHSKANYTVYEGWDAIFPETVIVGGNIQLKDGELCGEMTGRDING
ncbi:MAG: dihydroorotase [Methanomassiliicoccaceae archaeon]|jgi:dihydroorotase|nr:dihydroorotase [Methanomassiliicoccaceae archaeon]